MSADDGTAVALVDSWAAPRSRGTLQERFLAVRTAFDRAAGGPYRFDVAILAERWTRTASGSVTVDAWCSEVIFARDQPAYSSYVTEHLGLVWAGSAWLLESMTDSPGPSVALAASEPPTPGPEAAAALAGYVPAGTAVSGEGGGSARG